MQAQLLTCFTARKPWRNTVFRETFNGHVQTTLTHLVGGRSTIATKAYLGDHVATT